MRRAVALVAAVGLAGFAWPVGVVAVGFGFGLATSGLFGIPDVGTGALLVLVGLILLAAPVVLAALIGSRSRSVAGWVVGAGWLLAAGVFLYAAGAEGSIRGWFVLPDA